MPDRGDGHFPTTHWTLIARLKSSDETRVRGALEDICSQYHYPLYCYIRRRGLSHHDAEDALHDFLARLLRREAFESADPARGRLRGYLSCALQRFLINRHREGQARREDLHVSLDEVSLDDAGERYLREQLIESETPEVQFDRQWARELMNRVLGQLRERYAARGRLELFRALRPALLSGGSLRGGEVEELSRKLELSPGTVRVAHNRLLGRFRTLLEKEVVQTVDHPDDVKAELEDLMSFFARK